MGLIEKLISGRGVGVAVNEGLGRNEIRGWLKFTPGGLNGGGRVIGGIVTGGMVTDGMVIGGAEFKEGG